MTRADYLEGLFFFAAMLGATGAGAAALLTALGSPARGVARACAVGVLWLAGILAVHLVPGALGLLTRAGVLAASVIWVTGTITLRSQRPGPRRAPAPPASGATPALVVAYIALALAAAAPLALLLADVTSAPTNTDVVSFHLPNIARWIQSGTMWRVDDFIVGRAPGAYPQSGDVMMLAVVLPWRADFLVGLVNYPLLVLLGGAVYGSSRELGAPASTAVIATAVLISIPFVGWVAWSGLTDTLMLATFAAGCLFLLRQLRTGASADLLLAATALGVSFGTRWYGPPAVALLLAGWALAAVLGRAALFATLRRLATAASVVLAIGGFWLLRNLVELGNPFFPVRVAPFGLTVFAAPPDRYRKLEGFPLAHYAGNWKAWRETLWPTFLDVLSWASVALWVGLAAAAAMAFAACRRASGDDASYRAGLVLVLILVAIAIAGVYMVTPYTGAGPPGQPFVAYVNSRYVLPALVLAAIASAWALSRAAAGLRAAAEAIGLVVVLDGLHRTLAVPGPRAGTTEVVLGLALLSAAAAGLYLARMAAGTMVIRTTTMRVAATIALAAVVAVAGRVFENATLSGRWTERRYAPMTAVIAEAQAAPEGTRIGLAGEGWASYPLFGPRLANQVRAIARRSGGMLAFYPKRAEFDADVARNRYDLVAVQDISTLPPRRATQQERWLAQDGYRLKAVGNQVFAGGFIRLYARRGAR